MHPDLWNLLLAPMTLGGALWLWRTPRWPLLMLLGTLELLVAMGAGIAGYQWWDWQSFGAMRLVCWLLYAHAPVLLLVLGMRWIRDRRRLGALPIAACLGLVVVAVDAFLVEPQWLEQTQRTLEIPGLTEPLRIGLVADIQTDNPGPYEARTLRALAAAEPDLVLWAGDYVHGIDAEEDAAGVAALNAIIRGVNLTPALGSHAVRGDVDRGTWPAVFEGTSTTVHGISRTVDLGPVALTVLTPQDARSLRPPVPDLDKVHIVLGHAPDFALARPSADVLLAGHVHGGQVVLPFLGPPLTLTALPRDQASGHTLLENGSHLVVSRGIGMERARAPRLRFLCRPELTILDLVPAPAAS